MVNKSITRLIKAWALFSLMAFLVLVPIANTYILDPVIGYWKMIFVSTTYIVWGGCMNSILRAIKKLIGELQDEKKKRN